MPALPEFRAALVQHPEALAELSDDSLLRYTRGQLPRVLRWMMRYPALLHALARDAEQLWAQPEHALDPHRPAYLRTGVDADGLARTPADTCASSVP
jgi:hypothetical protein